MIRLGSDTKFFTKLTLPIMLVVFVACWRFLEMDSGVSLYLALNFSAFLIFGYDKSAARSGQRRVPEKFILCMALFGASLFIILGMMVFRHKIRDRTFLPKLVVLVVVQLIILGVLMPNFGF